MPSSDANKDISPKRGRGPLTWLLVGSLAVNAFVAALYFTGGLREREHRGPRAALMAFYKGSSEDVQRRMRELRQERRDAVRGLRAASWQARSKVHEAIAAEPFDAEALRASFSASRAARAQVHETHHEGLISLVSDLSAEDRARLAAELKKQAAKRDARRRERQER